MITRYGAGVVVVCGAAGAVIIAALLLLIEPGLLQGLLIAAAVILFLAVLSFFRDPERRVPSDEGVVIAPADGRVVQVKDVHEEEYLHQDAVQVSIFMSPLNVHVNRFPIAGRVELFRHIQGAHMVAFDEKSSDRNERTHIGMADRNFKVLFKQIAGTVARRIVAEVAVGQEARAGERFGMIRFGSRVDVILPKGTPLQVRLNDRVVGGETILARYPS